MKIYICQKFSAAHLLKNYSYDKDWNEAMYGKCGNLHGHTWKVEVWIDGKVYSESYMVVNFKEVKNVIMALDHKFLNKELSTDNVTAEWLVE